MLPATLLTVNTAASSTRLCLRADVAADLAAAGVSAADSAIDDAIDDATSQIRDHCRAPLAKEDVTETFRLMPTIPAGLAQDIPPALILRRRPIVSVTSITEDGTALVAGTDYELDSDAGLLWRLSNDDRVPWQAGKVAVRYLGGYVLPSDAGTVTLPRAIRRACISLAAGIIQQRGRDPLLRSEHVEGIGATAWYAATEQLDGSLPAPIAALLASYRFPAF